MLQLKIQHAIIKTEYNQINDLKKLCYLYKHIKKKKHLVVQSVVHGIAATVSFGSCWASLVVQRAKTACNSEDLGSICGSGRSPGEGNGNPLKYSCLEDPMDRGA